MSIIHVMVDEKFTKGIAKFYDKFYYEKEHKILYYNRNSKEESLINQELHLLQNEIKSTNDIIDSLRILRYIIKNDYVVFHSFVFPKVLKTILYLYRKLLSKIIWIEWGYDLYCEKEFFVNKKIKADCAAVVCIFPADCDVYLKLFPKHTSEVFYAPYMGYSPENMEIERFISLEEKINKGEPIIVQIGHSASRSINHKKAIKLLSRFSNENVKFLLPLSYGDMEYAQEIRKIAKNTFGDKTIIIDSFLPKDEYFRVISNVDIAIFPSKRQIALGNIHRLILSNTKLYLSKKGVMYKYFSKQGVPVYKMEDIDFISFEEFIAIPIAEDSQKFEHFKTTYFDYQLKKRHWDEVFLFFEHKQT